LSTFVEITEEKLSETETTIEKFQNGK
jgi:hypothetical protein